MNFFQSVLTAFAALGVSAANAATLPPNKITMSGAIIQDVEYGSSGSPGMVDGFGSGTTWTAELTITNFGAPNAVYISNGGTLRQYGWGSYNSLGTGSLKIYNASGEVLAAVAGELNAIFQDFTTGYPDYVQLSLACPVTCDVYYPKDPYWDRFASVQFYYRTESADVIVADPGLAALFEFLNILASPNADSLYAYSDYSDPSGVRSGFMAANIDGSGGFVGELGNVEVSTVTPVPLPNSIVLLGGSLGLAFAGRKFLVEKRRPC